jgi:hypothetical protein
LLSGLLQKHSHTGKVLPFLNRDRLGATFKNLFCCQGGCCILLAF